MISLNPYSTAAKLIGGGVVILALVLLVMSWSARGQEITSLADWQRTVVIATTDATVEASAKGIRKPLDAAAVPAAIAKLKRSTDSCLAASAERDRIATDAKTRADNADAALANAQVLMRGEYASAAKRIEALAAAKAKPTPDLACQAIGADSKAAWEGWK